MKTYILIYVLLFLSACKEKKQQTTAPYIEEYTTQLTKDFELHYKFDRASQIHILSSKLSEISSLEYDSHNSSFLTNDDENGQLYVLNKDDFSISESIKFGKKGDYEAIAKAGRDIIVSKNTGTLFFYNIDTQETTTENTSLKAINNVEGLCHIPAQDLLLLACKGVPLKNEELKKKDKCIYSFDLKSKKLNPQPFITIGQKQLQAVAEKHYKTKNAKVSNKLISKIKEFAPSGIAVNPVDGRFYILSARGSTLLIVNKDKTLNNIIFLDSTLIPQPEGITFDKYANLYIATEGHGKSSKVFKFLFE